MTRIKTYLVEDCHITRDLIADALEANANAQVIAWASTETEASNWLVKNKTGWDLVVLDLFLAEGSGLQVLKSLSKRTNQRVVVLSNYLTPTVRQRCISMGADEVLDKSTQLDQFLDFVSAAQEVTCGA